MHHAPFEVELLMHALHQIKWNHETFEYFWKWADFSIWFSLHRAKKCFDENDIDPIVLRVFCVCVLEKIWVSCMLLLRYWNNSTCCRSILRICMIAQPFNHWIISFNLLWCSCFVFSFHLLSSYSWVWLKCSSWTSILPPITTTDASVPSEWNAGCLEALGILVVKSTSCHEK